MHKGFPAQASRVPASSTPFPPFLHRHHNFRHNYNKIHSKRGERECVSAQNTMMNHSYRFSVAGQRSPACRNLHIRLLELYAVRFSLPSFSVILRQEVSDSDRQHLCSVLFQQTGRHRANGLLSESEGSTGGGYQYWKSPPGQFTLLGAPQHGAGHFEQDQL